MPAAQLCSVRPATHLLHLLPAGSSDQVDFVSDFLRLDVRGKDGHNHFVVHLTKKLAAPEAGTRLLYFVEQTT